MSNTAPVFSHISLLYPWSLMVLFGWQGKCEITTTVVAFSRLSPATFNTSLWCCHFRENVGISLTFIPPPTSHEVEQTSEVTIGLHNPVGQNFS